MELPCDVRFAAEVDDRIGPRIPRPDQHPASERAAIAKSRRSTARRRRKKPERASLPHISVSYLLRSAQGKAVRAVTWSSLSETRNRSRRDRST